MYDYGSCISQVDLSGQRIIREKDRVSYVQVLALHNSIAKPKTKEMGFLTSPREQRIYVR